MMIQSTDITAISGSKKRKVLLFLIMLVFTTFVLVGKSQHAEGTGKTIEEAKRNAQLNLASQFQSRVTSTSILSISEQNSKKEESFSEDTTITADSVLLGVKFKQDILQKDPFSVIAYIDESSLPQYLQKLDFIKQKIEEIENRLEGDLSEEIKKNHYLLLMDYYEDFEKYSIVAKTLDEEAPLSQLKRTKAGAELDYYQLLKNEQKLLQKDFQNFALQNKASQQLQEIIKKISENKKEIEEWESAQARKRQQSLEQTDILLQQKLQDMQQLANKWVDESLVLQAVKQDPLDQISSIEQLKQTHNKITVNRENELAALKQAIIDRYASRIQEIENQPYRSAELRGNIPTDTAEKNRKKAIKELINSRDLELVNTENLLSASVAPQLNDLEENIVKEYKKIEQEKYQLSSLNNAITIRIGAYDGFRNSWPVAIRFNVLEQNFSYDLYLPYDKVTGKPLPDLTPSTEKEYSAYADYLDTVDILEAYFASFEKPLICSAEYSIQIGRNASEYVILINSIQLNRIDTNLLIYNERFPKQFDTIKIYTYNFPTSIPALYESEYQKYVNRKDKRIQEAEILNTTSFLKDDFMLCNLTTKPEFALMIEGSIRNIFDLPSSVTPYFRAGFGWRIWFHSFQEEEKDLYGNVVVPGVRDLSSSLFVSLGYLRPLKYFNQNYLAWSSTIDFGVGMVSLDSENAKFFDFPGNITTGIQWGSPSWGAIQISACFRFLGHDFGHLSASIGLLMNINSIESDKENTLILHEGDYKTYDDLIQDNILRDEKNAQIYLEEYFKQYGRFNF